MAVKKEKKSCFKIDVVLIFINFWEDRFKSKIVDESTYFFMIAFELIEKVKKHWKGVHIYTAGFNFSLAFHIIGAQHFIESFMIFM